MQATPRKTSARSRMSAIMVMTIALSLAGCTSQVRHGDRPAGHGSGGKRYRFRFDAAAISPVRPGTTEPWVGEPDTSLASAIGAAAGFVTVGAEGAMIGAELGAALARISHKNQPWVFAEIALPDGRRFVTPGRRGLYSQIGAEFVEESDTLDARTFTLRLYHWNEGDEEDIAFLRLRYGDLVTGKVPGAPPRALLGLQISVTEERIEAPGYVSGMRLKKARGDNSSDWSNAVPGSTGYRIDRVEITASESDIGADGFDNSAPDPFVKLRHDGHTIFHGTTVEDDRNATWAPESTYVFLRPTGTLAVEIWDADAMEDDWIATVHLRAEAFVDGHVEARSTGGSVVVLRVSRRPSGPQ